MDYYGILMTRPSDNLFNPDTDCHLKIKIMDSFALGITKSSQVNERYSFDINRYINVFYKMDENISWKLTLKFQLVDSISDKERSSPWEKWINEIHKMSFTSQYMIYELNPLFVMAVPKKRTSRSKKRIRKNVRKGKACRAAIKAFSLAKSISTGHSKSFYCIANDDSSGSSK